MTKQFTIQMLNNFRHTILLDNPTTLEEITMFIANLDSDFLVFKGVVLASARTYEIALNVKHIISIE
jgi:hypothetical protein